MPKILHASWLRLLSLAAATVIATACQGAQAPAPGGDAPGAPQDAKPKVDRIVFAIGAPGTEANTPRDSGPTQHWTTRPSYDFLSGVDVDGKDVLNKVPDLATEWSLEPDGKSYRFKLRKGVQFHFDKGEFTAQDVVFSMQHITAQDSPHPHRGRYLQQIAKIEPVNDYEVVFHLNAPDLAFIWNVGRQEGLTILSKKDADSRAKFPPNLLEQAVAGTGPYFVKDRKQGQYIRFERVPWQHYRKSAEFPEFEWRFINENSTRLAALLAKEVHMAAVPMELIPQAERQGFKAIKARAPMGTMTFVQFLGPWNKPAVPTVELDPNVTSPLSDVRVRRALSKAINRDELNKAFEQGKADLAYNTFFHPTRSGWNPDWERRFTDEYGYEPAKARELLAQAGYSSGSPLKHTFNLSGNYGYYPELKDMAEAISNYWRAIGVEVTLEQLDPVASAGKANARAYTNNSSLVATSIRQFFGIGIYGAGAMINTDGVIGGKSGGDFIEFSDLVMNKLRRTLDPSQWEATYKETGNMLYDKHSLIPLFWLPVYALVDPNIVADYQFSGTLTGPYADIEYIKPAR